MSTGKIFLIGYMACGKTTFGRALAAATSRSFVDLDSFIEQSCGKSVSRIFAEDGEEEFRRLESEALLRLVSMPGDAVIACGGGTPCFASNMELMTRTGLTVWLTASVDTIMRRLLADRSGRPLVARFTDTDDLRTYVSASLDSRTPAYSRAAVTFDSSRLESADEIAGSVNRFINLHL